MVFYKNLSSSVDSLLDRGYSALGAFSVSSKSTTKDGVTLNFNAKQKAGSDNVTGGFKFCQVFKKDDLTVDLVGAISEEGTVKDELTLKGVAEGLEFNVNTTLIQTAETETEPLKDEKAENKKTRNQIGGGLTYVKDKVGVNVNFTKKHLNAVVAKVDVAGEVSENVALGFKISAPLKKIEVAEGTSAKVFDLDVSAKLATQDVTVLGKLTDCGQKTSLTVLHNVCSHFTVGAEFTGKGMKIPFCFKKNGEEEVVESEEPAVRAWGLTMGFQYKTDSNSTLRAKVNDKGIATASYDFELKENLRANLVAETKVSALGNGSKLGLSLSYSS